MIRTRKNGPGWAYVGNPPPDFAIFGLAGWTGPQKLGRAGSGRGVLHHLALEFGRRWQPTAFWCEVDSYRPPNPHARPGERIQTLGTAEDRVARELLELQDPAAPGGMTIPEAAFALTRTIQVEGEAHQVRVFTAGPVGGAATTVSSGGIVLVTWYGAPDAPLPAVEPVDDLGAFQPRTGGEPGPPQDGRDS